MEKGIQLTLATIGESTIDPFRDVVYAVSTRQRRYLNYLVFVWFLIVSVVYVAYTVAAYNATPPTVVFSQEHIDVGPNTSLAELVISSNCHLANYVLPIGYGPSKCPIRIINNTNTTIVYLSFCSTIPAFQGDRNFLFLAFDPGCAASLRLYSSYYYYLSQGFTANFNIAVSKKVDVDGMVTYSPAISLGGLVVSTAGSTSAGVELTMPSVMDVFTYTRKNILSTIGSICGFMGTLWSLLLYFVRVYEQLIIKIKGGCLRKKDDGARTPAELEIGPVSGMTEDPVVVVAAAEQDESATEIKLTN